MSNEGFILIIMKSNRSKIKRFLKKIIVKLPISHHLYKLGKYGPSFFIYRFLCKRHEFLSSFEMERYQLRKMRALLKNASRQVPFYRDFFRENHLSREDFKALEDISKLPIIQKSFMRRKTEQFMADNREKFRPKVVTTSGSTGMPFQFYIDSRLLSFYDVLFWRWHNWAGYNLNDRHALMCMPIGYRQGKINKEDRYFCDFINKMLELNTHFFEDEYLHEMVRLIKNYKVDVLLAYPSLLFQFAKFLDKEKINLPMRVLLTQAEMLYPAQREKIESVFKRKISNSYGMEERTIFANECSEGRMHVSFDSGLLEVIKNGKPCKPGEIGEFVVTGFHNRSMPFIRYATGDFGCYKEERCPCGSSFSVIEIYGGRGKSLFATSQGYLITSPDYVFFDKNLSRRIKQIQIFQDKINEISLKVVKENSFSEEDTRSLLALYSRVLGGKVKVHVEFVDKIERLSSGKFNYVDSKIKPTGNNREEKYVLGRNI